jgi:hypothetical protein
LPDATESERKSLLKRQKVDEAKLDKAAYIEVGGWDLYPGTDGIYERC